MTLRRHEHYKTKSDIIAEVGFSNYKKFVTWVDRNKLTCVNDEQGKNIEAYFTYDLELFVKQFNINKRI